MQQTQLLAQNPMWGECLLDRVSGQLTWSDYCLNERYVCGKEVGTFVTESGQQVINQLACDGKRPAQIMTNPKDCAY